MEAFVTTVNAQPKKKKAGRRFHELDKLMEKAFFFSIGCDHTGADGVFQRQPEKDGSRMVWVGVTRCLNGPSPEVAILTGGSRFFW